VIRITLSWNSIGSHSSVHLLHFRLHATRPTSACLEIAALRSNKFATFDIFIRHSIFFAPSRSLASYSQNGRAKRMSKLLDRHLTLSSSSSCQEMANEIKITIIKVVVDKCSFFTASVQFNHAKLVDLSLPLFLILNKKKNRFSTLLFYWSPEQGQVL
jgi:hypothetical protein